MPRAHSINANSDTRSTAPPPLPPPDAALTVALTCEAAENAPAVHVSV
jgi:hypothetical protein